jgi:hypothetical protein
MEAYANWIETTYNQKGSVRRICALFASLLTIPQLSILSTVSYTCRAHREDRSLGYRHQQFVRSRQKCVVQPYLSCWWLSIGKVVHKLPQLTQRTPRHVFSPTRKYVFNTYSLFVAYQILVKCTQQASRARITPFFCAASPNVRPRACSQSGYLGLLKNIRQ